MSTSSSPDVAAPTTIFNWRHATVPKAREKLGLPAKGEDKSVDDQWADFMVGHNRTPVAE